MSLLRTYLRHTSSGLVSLLLVAPVTRGQRVLETVRNNTRLDGQLQVKVFPTVNELLGIDPYFFGQILEESEMKFEYAVVG